MYALSGLLLVALLAAPAHADTAPPAEGAAPASSAAPAAAPPERAALPERSERDAAALAARLPAEQQHMLEADDRPFLTLTLPANRAEAKGTVILLPGDDESADWPRVVGPLRRALPDDGWRTLSLTLPDPLDENASVRGEAGATAAPDAAASEPANEPPADAPPPPPAPPLEERLKTHADHVFARLSAALADAARQQPASVVLVGNGTGAYWAVRFVSEHSNDAIKHVVLVDAEVPRGYPANLDTLAPALKTGVADLLSSASPDVRTAAEQRLRASKRLAHPDYQQIRLDGLSADRDVAQAQIARRIEGWLDRR